MKVAIVNNGSAKPQKLIDLIGAEPVVYGFADAEKVLADDFDLIVLSGSSQFPIAYNKDVLSGEISLIQNSKSPILGICYGAELINVAFGGSLKDMGAGSNEKSIVEVLVQEKHPLFCEKTNFEVYDSHRWVIDAVGTDIAVLASSSHGPEVIRHKHRPIFGFQFHPEKMLDETFGDELYRSFIGLYVSNNQ